MNKLTVAVASVAAAITLAACGSAGSPSSNDGDVASLGSTTTAVGATTPSTESADGSTDPQQAMLDYTQCMRDNGIDLPDPQFSSASGGGVISKRVDAGDAPAEDAPEFDPDSQQFEDADAECQPLLRDAVGSREIDPEEQAEMREQMLAFAQCMRDHGVDFPDPEFTDDGGGVSVHVGTADDDGPQPGDPEVDAAMEECSAANGGPLIVTDTVGG
jgi:hypothetical protein